MNTVNTLLLNALNAIAAGTPNPVQLAADTLQQLEDRKVKSIVIERDDHPESPRDYFEPVATLACHYRGYALGDRDGWDRLARELGLDQAADADDKFALLQAGHRNPDLLMLPLYVYEHGQLTISAGVAPMPGDAWDTSLVGAVFVSRAYARDQWGDTFLQYNGDPDSEWRQGAFYHRLSGDRVRSDKGSTIPVDERFTPVSEEDVWTFRMKKEVEEYARFLEGAVYTFTIWEHDTDQPPKEGVRIDEDMDVAPPTFYGSDPHRNGMVSEWPLDWQENYRIVDLS